MVLDKGVFNPPVIPIAPDKAFYPLRRDETGKIVPSYQFRICVKSFIVCLKWEKKKVFFYDLEWFWANGFGLYKRPAP